jgi:hypothetical protein
LRLALVLNGGVSLAVWIGGVIDQIDALRCASPAAAEAGEVDKLDQTCAIYARLLKALRLTVAVDIIAGRMASRQLPFRRPQTDLCRRPEVTGLSPGRASSHLTIWR